MGKGTGPTRSPKKWNRHFLRCPPPTPTPAPCQNYSLVKSFQYNVWVFSVAWSGRLLAVGVQDKQVRVYDGEQAGWAKGSDKGPGGQKSGIDPSCNVGQPAGISRVLWIL